jgi:hypothetical protein
VAKVPKPPADPPTMMPYRRPPRVSSKAALSIQRLAIPLRSDELASEVGNSEPLNTIEGRSVPRRKEDPRTNATTEGFHGYICQPGRRLLRLVDHSGLLGQTAPAMCDHATEPVPCFSCHLGPGPRI